MSRDLMRSAGLLGFFLCVAGLIIFLTRPAAPPATTSSERGMVILFECPDGMTGEACMQRYSPRFDSEPSVEPVVVIVSAVGLGLAVSALWAWRRRQNPSAT
ncbi:hypothetical protein [Lentzea sp.]|uniref:hypothetical protein n=1 Tax=Lentzea sp. TaxID=56099 RepID=UPI002C699320|nr:hypothetical protein [Lentzea sp.]HUQ59164.1 hypothetical protein [Lentzea sp.]